jgi:hypothetical protein
MPLIDVLRRCRELASTSEDAASSATTVAQIIATLDRSIEALERGLEPDRDALCLLFAPTGALQETSIQNGWSVEYLLFSAEFDAFTQ